MKEGEITTTTNPDDPINYVKNHLTTDEEPTGLTKREYFAAMVMCGADKEGYFDPLTLSFMCVEAADALIAELNKPINTP